jgi:hypothetical protein
MRGAVGFALCGLVLLALGGCTAAQQQQLATTHATVQAAISTAATNIANVNATVVKFTQADVTSAKNDADQHGDTVASSCYAYVLANLDAVNGDISLPVGAVSAFQKVRDGAQGLGSAASNAFLLACAPLKESAEGDIMTAASLATALAAKVGLKIALPAIPAL